MAETTGNSTAELIALGRTSYDNTSRMSGNDTADLVALGDSHYTRQSSQRPKSATMQPSVSPPLRLSHAPKASTYNEGAANELFSDMRSRSPSFESRLKDLSVASSNNRSAARVGFNGIEVSPSKTMSTQMDSSITSSVALPQHPASDGIPPSYEFAHIGMRPRSTREINGYSSGNANSLGSSSSVIGATGSMVGSGLGASSITHHLYHHFDRASDRAGVNLPDFSSSLPLDNSGRGRLERDGLSTMPSQTSQSNSRRYTSNLPQSNRQENVALKSHSYDNLQNLMHDTVALSRAAVQTSPLRKGTDKPQSPGASSLSQHSSGNNRRDLKASQKSTRATTSSRTNPRPTSSRSTGSLTTTGKTKPSSAPVSPKGIVSPSRKDKTDRTNKKVSFHVSRSSTERSPRQKTDNTTEILPKKKTQTSATTSASSRVRQSNTSPKHMTFPGPSSSNVGSSRVGRSLFTTLPSNTDIKPQTFAEYLDKYYGILDRRDKIDSTNTEDGEATSAHSDSAFEFSDASPGRNDDYSADADVSEEEILRQAVRRSVRFEGFEDDSAPGRMGTLRQKLSTEGKKSRSKAHALARLYNMELGDYAEELHDQMKSTREKSRETDDEYKKRILRQPRINKLKPKKTSLLRPRVRTRSTSAQSRGRKPSVTRGRKRSASASPAVGRRRRKTPVQVTDDDLLPWLLEEFPFLHLSKETLHELWSKSSRQLEQLTRAQQEVKRKKSKGQVQVEEALRRHTILKNIMDKELSHNQRMKEIKGRQSSQQSVRSQICNKRQQSARARRYYDEFQIRNRSRMLKKKTREELVFKKLFKDGLDIQKDRIRDMRRYAKDEREVRAAREQDELEAIENYYRDQFSMISEVIDQERQDLRTKDVAQSKVVTQMKRELRHKMEREIRSFQNQLYRDEDEEYFRKLDAEHLRHQLQVARYQASV